MKDEASKVETLCIKALFVRARTTVLYAPLGTLFLGWVEMNVVSLSVVLTWMIINTIPDALTLWLTTHVIRSDLPDERLSFWYNAQVGLRALQGMCWGSAAIFFHVQGPNSFTNDLMVMVVLVAVCVTAVIDMAPSFRTLATFCISFLSVIVLQFFLMGDKQHDYFAAGGLLLMVVVLQFGWDAFRQFREGVRQVVMNQEISKKLATAMEEAKIAHSALELRNGELDKAIEELSFIATHDKLTGLFNRHFIVDQLERQRDMFERYGNVCSIVLIDIDHFKQVNDRFGHAVGDEVLRSFARCVEPLLRQGDYLGRYGGEEFMLVLPMTGLESANHLAQRIRNALTSCKSRDRECAMPTVTASFGVAQLREDEKLDDWLVRADQAMYRAKANGRDCVVVD